MKKQPNKKKKELVTKEISTEQNAVYSDPKDAANMQTVPHPKDYEEIEY
ncbi:MULTISPECIES: hypothetical protein [Bacillus cereus group]|uniref:Spore cortex-lytic enzyme n=1 Tax=Bacillus cytotoxicus (strain DSM 22905 / CIP 110041 / 391-98 / NVH 391-98) TaxID=315749 RepID=A7GPU0_BACCN|nr:MULTISPECIES: hypothetical protein [Bacillus cereus group]ABS22148.1 conserved hypothetical protein [Bacillus cytotoxicus NVH 391-98]AWC44829.1 hypothetical protein CG479_010070 [Bacillus cytotoxicus]EMA6343021.1 hypothetical protein [Bacillus cytotoxicus]MDH2864345.1 hypothetical protein [Bacillus cytotoxicus]MDH2885418.1 hypothetical protein [Bacillus cytotoxicus]